MREFPLARKTKSATLGVGISSYLAAMKREVMASRCRWVVSTVVRPRVLSRMLTDRKAVFYLKLNFSLTANNH